LRATSWFHNPALAQFDGRAFLSNPLIDGQVARRGD
jgi:hypothetical protein